jgi:hypothetical protein
LRIFAAKGCFQDRPELGAKADEFLGYIATLPYDGAKPNEAKAWVQGKASGSATFGGAKFARV